MKKVTAIIAALCLWNALPGQAQSPLYTEKAGVLALTEQGASHFAKLPLKCMQQPFPYKTGIVFSDSSLITAPKDYHPAFYGCFDWHSSVHGHWMLVRLLKMFPNLPEAATIRQKLKENLSEDNIQQELKLFRNRDNKGFERIYGWSWLMQLQRELATWNDPLGVELSKNVAPLAGFFSKSYVEFLGKLAYPIRVGEHTNLAFGLTLAWDYAVTTKDVRLENAIRKAATQFYLEDKACPVAYEPGGYDFLSPCLEEADLMWRVLDAAQYQKWLKTFLPQIYVPGKTFLSVGQVKDRTDGKLVHLDGLNLSRAWCLYNIARHAGSNEAAIRGLAKRHLDASLGQVASGDYAGEHWLASFAVYALTAEAQK
ncbi:DUF2891 domain-containing protein [Chitinophaga horti]|uniref:DUF2891 domain-containing protein n=1 Tax=Chitinophaga horti TaxID=2920382 RepID=A0ABY6IZS3_9BACT|nr:DUF2891 domain-containing protein [Chitinophaga horti]UYQ92918.1 DUF2891 domain-containing protein [Chitinophaga horti]